MKLVAMVCVEAGLPLSRGDLGVEVICHPLLRFGLARWHWALLVLLVPVRVPWRSQGKRGIVARATVASLAQGFIQDFSGGGGGGGAPSGTPHLPGNSAHYQCFDS